MRKDGTRFWTGVVIDPVHDDNGTLVGYAKVTRDISDKKRAQEALFAAEQRFRCPFWCKGARTTPIFMLDQDGRITNWNAGAQAIKGYGAHEIIGEHFSRFYTPEDRARGEPQRAIATRLARRPLSGRRLAHAQGWHALLGQRGHRSHPR